MENKLDAFLKQMKSSKSASTVTNPRFETNDTQNIQLLGSKIDKSIGVQVRLRKEDYLLQASTMRALDIQPNHCTEMG